MFKKAEESLASMARENAVRNLELDSEEFHFCLKAIQDLKEQVDVLKKDFDSLNRYINSKDFEHLTPELKMLTCERRTLIAGHLDYLEHIMRVDFRTER